jgi:hypothetical protein
MSRTLVLAMVLALGGAARAEDVDWSQYIDKNPSAPVKSAPVQVASAKPKAAPARSATKVAAKPKPKARAKPKARH